MDGEGAMKLCKMTIRLDAETRSLAWAASKNSWRTVSQYISYALHEQAKRDAVDRECVDCGQAGKVVAFLRDARVPSGTEAVSKFLKAMIDSKLWNGKIE
jgi:hypothetical protein